MSRAPQEDRCPRSDLYRTQCGHCRESTPQAPIFLEPEPQLREERPYAVSIHPTTRPRICADCGLTIRVGTSVTQMSDDTYLCSECRP